MKGRRIQLGNDRPKPDARLGDGAVCKTAILCDTSHGQESMLSRVRLIRCLLPLHISLGFSQPGAAQQPCAIDLDRSTTLGNETTAPLSTAITLVRHRDRYLLAHVAAQSAVLIFDSTGHYLSTLGRAGAGPGEFRSVVKIVPWPGDSIAVWDAGNARVGVYGDLSSLPRYFSAVGVREAVVLADGRIVVNTQLGSAPKMALHTLLPNGSLGASYDAADDERGEPWRFRRSLAKTADGHVWSAHQTAYHLDLWSPTGELLRTIEQKPPWFPGGVRYGLALDANDKPPNSGLIDIAVDDRRLLLLFHVPDARWRTALTQRPGLYGRLTLAIADHNLFWDTVVEVLEPVTGRVLASRRFDQALLGFADGGHVYAEDTAPDDQFTVGVWRITHTCGG